jgi:CheY-like chemotaxis protein
VERRFGGLGLGLTIAAGIVAEHRGTLTASSDGRDRGAAFELTLADARPAAATLPPPAVSGRTEAVRGWHVLLVEDNADAAEALKVALEDSGYRVTHAASCGSALSVAETVRFDAVVTDLGLPDGSGIAIGRALSSTTPVIALSGYGAATDRRACDEAGFAAHLLKPADPDLLEATLRRVIGAR